MSVTRGAFLRQLSKSLPGMVFGTGAAAAQTLLAKMAAASGTSETSEMPVPVQIKRRATAPLPPFLTSGPTGRAEIALTFDDGPHPGVTDRILDELKARKMHATFFMIGQCVAAAPELARRVHAEGHDIGNHTYTHPNLTELPEAQVLAEIQKTQAIIQDELKLTPAWFRPPFGAFRANQSSLSEQAGMRVVLWSTDSDDWTKPGEDRIVGTLAEKTPAGSIVLLHDSQEQTGNCIGRILDGVSARGLQPVTLSRLMSP